MTNRRYKWLHDFLARLKTMQIATADLQLQYLNQQTLPLVVVDATVWGRVLRQAAERQYRFAGIWARDLSTSIEIDCCCEFLGEHFILRTAVLVGDERLDSITPYYVAANRLERHIHDMFGVVFIDHPDQRRWTRHQAWAENQFPLRKNFVGATQDGSNANTNVCFAKTACRPTPADTDYPFVQAHGTGVYEIPVGPVHAGIIEPGHFRFQVAGEDIINLEERLGYVHKGIEKLAVGRDFAGLLRLAGRVSGDSTVAHTWAACRACEAAFAIAVPPRALLLRAIMCERERIANHLGDFAAICNDVGFAFAYYQMMRLKELWLRLNAQIFGHRFMMDCMVVGGVAVDLSGVNGAAMRQQLVELKKELDELYPMISENSSLHDRLKTTGVLPHEVAVALGALGYVGRASGCKFDLRRDAPYPPYDQLQVQVPVYTAGDVLARARVRADEILIALKLLHQLLDRLLADDGSSINVGLRADMDAAAVKQQAAQGGAEGVGLIEGWRGEVLAYVSFGADGFVQRYFPRDPSWFSWPALEQLIHGNIVPDFPVCNKSINGSYAGVDL
jgi:Ni,Fe-hydrogenase III large subunit